MCTVKEGNVLFNDAFNTLFMVILHCTCGKGPLRVNLLMPHGFLLATRVLLYAPSNRQDSTYHDLCYTSHGASIGLMFSNILKNSKSYAINKNVEQFINGYIIVIKGLCS